MTRKTIIEIDVPVVCVAVLILSWSAVYFLTTLTGTEEGPETVLFIRPVFYGILVCFPFVLWQALSFHKKDGPAAGEQGDRHSQRADTGETSGEADAGRDKGFLEKNRLFFLAASALYCLLMPVLGYLIPSVIYVMVSCYFLGSRSLWILIVLPLGLSGLMAFIFKVLLSIPVPIWPV